MPKASDYSKGFIYKIVCNDINVLSTYTGSSVNWIKRKTNHKSDCNCLTSARYNRHVYEVMRTNGGWDNWTMLKICDFPCNTKFELEAEERRHMELLGSDMNKCIPTQTQKEYRDLNKNKIKQKDKKYQQDNKDKINARIRANRKLKQQAKLDVVIAI